jgi:hypothetical protein
MMDAITLKELITEAQKNHRRSKRLFEKHDNSEDMHEMETWASTVVWLKSKLAAAV